MAIPDFQSLLLPLLKLAADAEEHTLAGAIDQLAEEFQLSAQERAELLPSGRQPRFNNRVGWASTYLRKAGLLRTMARRGCFQLTDRGRDVLASKPARIDLQFLESRFTELTAFRNRDRTPGEEGETTFNEDEAEWRLRADVEQRVADQVKRLLPNESVRRDALEFLAFAIENADEERDDAWYLRQTPNRLKLVTGGLTACEVTRTALRVSVIGPIGEEVREAIGAEVADDYVFSSIPGALFLALPLEKSPHALVHLKEGLNAFVDVAMGRVRRPPNLVEHHVPEAVGVVGHLVGRQLPQPEPGEQVDEVHDEEGEVDESDPIASREPKVRGRPQIFERGERTIASLMSDVDRETIALPDLQRPFVWEDIRVRNLFDSLFLGFPVGTLVLWHTATGRDARAIGTDRAPARPPTLVIDGQQRLTSLFAVMQGKRLVGPDGDERKITLGFRPRDGRFEVVSAAIRNDPEFLADVTELWTGTRPNSQIRRELLNALRDAGRAVDDRYEDAVERNLEVAKAITNYRFPTIEIRETGQEDLAEEAISEIFVRINNEGKRLGQADFVLTLLSVYHGKLRDLIEERAREMSESSVVALDTQQLLRAACGVAFNRARMSAVYKYLRGIDPNTREPNPDRRQQMILQLDEAAKACMEKTPWRDFLLRVRHAGFVGPALIASKNAIVNAYAFHTRGRRAGVPKARLDELISRWVFGTLMTARYSGMSETAFEQDLARVADLDPEGFVGAMDEALRQAITPSYWAEHLFPLLETQKARAPAALAFRAAQVVLGARALFSDQLLQNVLDPPSTGTRAAGELHHLFPKDWLESHGMKDRRRANQVANLADVGWHENSTIGSRGPSDYVPRLRQHLNLDDDKWGRQCAEHALPLGWENMDFETFLLERRRRMADLVRVAFRKLGGEGDGQPLTPPWFLPGAEVVWQRIAETERALRAMVREVYKAAFGDAAADKLQEALPEQERKTLERALRSRPQGSDPLTVVDYVYLGQLPPLLFLPGAWQRARERFGGGDKVKEKLAAALTQIAPVRNEIAHVREVSPERLQRANVACSEVLEMLRGAAR